jgi:hypothetical protein
VEREKWKAEDEEREKLSGKAKSHGKESEYCLFRPPFFEDFPLSTFHFPLAFQDGPEFRQTVRFCQIP